MKNVWNIANSVRDSTENKQVLLSGIIKRENRNYNDKILEINARMASYSEGHKLIFTTNNDSDGTCLNRRRLHLNKKGYSKFLLNLIELMKSIYFDFMHAAQLRQTSSNISLCKSIYEALKCHRHLRTLFSPF